MKSIEWNIRSSSRYKKEPIRKSGEAKDEKEVYKSEIFSYLSMVSVV